MGRPEDADAALDARFEQVGRWYPGSYAGGFEGYFGYDIDDEEGEPVYRLLPQGSEADNG